MGAFALASNGAFGTGYGWASTEAGAVEWAGKYAKETCQDYGGQDCRVVLTKTTSGAALNSGAGGALPAPTTNIVEEFFEFLSACVEDRLPNDPTCSAAVKGMAAADLNPVSVVSCLENALEHGWLAAVALATCLTAQGINVFFIWWDATHPAIIAASQPAGSLVSRV